MATETLPSRSIPWTLEDDPYFYGWRMVRQRDADGKETMVRVPLTAWDVLHPEEDDFIVQTDAHDTDCYYLKAVFQDLTKDRPNTIVFHDMRIDFQAEWPSVFGPDTVIFENLNAPWKREIGTFKVKEMDARPLLAIEVVSINTADIDRVEKVREYARVGIPLYVVVDRVEIEGESLVQVYGYRETPDGYVRLPDDPNGVWIETCRVWVRSGGDRVVVVEENGKVIPDRPELVEQNEALEKERDQQRLRAEQEKLRAEQEKLRAEQLQQRAEQFQQRAEQEKLRAEQEKQRANENAQKVAELERELRRLRGESS